MFDLLCVPDVSPAKSGRLSEGQNFTAKFVENCPIPKEPEGRNYFYDIKQRGLILMVTGRGIKSFQVRGRFQGRSVRVTIGRFPEISIENARKKAIEVLGKFAQGDNPVAEKQAIRQEETFGEFFKLYLENYAKIRKRSWKGDEWQVNRYLKDWFTFKLSAISKQDIVARHLRVTNVNGDYSANRLLSCIHTIFSKAIEWGWNGVNPAQGVKKNRENSRERFLQPEELTEFMKALAVEEATSAVAADFFRVALQTGARRSNVLSMRWAEISLQNRLWIIPAVKSKNGEPLNVPLTNSVLEILEKRRKANIKDFGEETQWVFRGRTPDQHFKEPKMAWKRILATAKISDLRIHDLRRTFGSYMAAQGATTSIIGKSLGHKSPDATKVYERLNLDPVRQFVEKTEDMFNAKPKEKEETAQASQKPEKAKKKHEKKKAK